MAHSIIGIPLEAKPNRGAAGPMRGGIRWLTATRAAGAAGAASPGGLSPSPAPRHTTLSELAPNNS